MESFVMRIMCSACALLAQFLTSSRSAEMRGKQVRTHLS
jgi:hypothetical protein